MTARSTARFALRAATAGDHDRVDAAFGAFDLTDRDQYRGFLRAQADAHLPAEHGIDRIDLTASLPDWAERRRSEALLLDLGDLDENVAMPTDVPDWTSVEAALGAVYVLEGSRLGGRMLARSLPPGFPRRFLDAGVPALWQRLVETLDTHLTSQDKLDVATDAARAVFARFEASARRHREDL